MAIKKRLLAAAGVIAVAGAAVCAAAASRLFPGTTEDNGLLHRPTLTLWYTDEKLEDYLASVAVDYQNAAGVGNSGVKKRAGISGTGQRRFPGGRKRAGSLYCEQRQSAKRRICPGLRLRQRTKAAF